MWAVQIENTTLFSKSTCEKRMYKGLMSNLPGHQTKAESRERGTVTTQRKN